MLDLDALCRRIGYEGTRAVDRETLAGLQRAFTLAVPFENLDLHLGRALRLDPTWLHRKIVEEGRGGLCYELNGYFGAVLGQMGFAVTLLGVSLPAVDGSGWTSPFVHAALRVELEEAYLVDVGFGDAIRAPLRLAAGVTQSDGWDEYRLERLPSGGWQLFVREPDGEWRARQGFEEEARALTDFAPACERLERDPDSLFRKGFFCCRVLPEGRITLTDQKLVEIGRDGRRERLLAGRGAFEEALRTHFGLAWAALKARAG